MTTDDVHPPEMPDAFDDFLDDLRRAAASVPAPVPGDGLHRLFRDGTVPMPAPRRSRVTALRVAVVTAIAGTTFGTLGVAGALPPAVQEGVADVADVVGVHLPDGHDDPTTTTTTTSTSTSTSTSVPERRGTPATTDDQGRPPGKPTKDRGRTTSTTNRVAPSPPVTPSTTIAADDRGPEVEADDGDPDRVPEAEEHRLVPPTDVSRRGGRRPPPKDD